MYKTKKCIKCNIIKSTDDFGKYKTARNIGLRSVCKVCFKLQKAEHYKNNSDRWKKTNNCTEASRKSKKKWKLNNPDKVREINRRYELKNRDRRNKQRRERRKSDPSYRMAMNLRRAVIRRIKGEAKGGSAVSDLGCTIDQLKIHLESKFYKNIRTGEEMSWDNYGHKGWHIDHIVPLASFDLTDRRQFLKACHYTNLQPLWWFDNLSKGAKYEKDCNI